MAKADLTVRVADLPQVKAALQEQADRIDDLRNLLQTWEPRIICPQCGLRYRGRACGPTHAVIKAMVYPTRSSRSTDGT